MAGGVGVTIRLSSSERYSRNLGFNNAWRPVASAPASVAPGSSLVLARTLFTGLSEASGGNASQNSPSNFPMALLQSQGNEQQRFLGSNPLVNWTSTQLTTGAVTGFSAGPAWVTLFVNGIPSVAKSLIALGSHSITAAYAGDANNTASVSSAVIQVVSSTALSVDPPAPTAGQAVMLTAMVSGFSPTGSVQFKDGATNLGSAVPLSGGIATLSTSALTAGGHSLTAVYLGDVNNVASTSPGVSRMVNKAASNSTLSAIPSSPASAATVTLTAAVSGCLPAGSVQFFDGATSLGTVAVNAGLAVLSINTLAVGGHTITASYSGDANNQASTSPALALTVTAGQVGGGDADIPTMPEWGAILLGLTLLTLGKRRRSQTARR